MLAQPAKVTLSSNETTRMQNFAVRVPHLNAKSISDPGFETLGLTDKNKKLVIVVPLQRSVRLR